jgi:hypothetical protein
MSAATLEVKTKDGNVYFERMGDIYSYQDLQNKEEDCSDRIRKIKTQLMNLALATPKDVFPSCEQDERTPFDQVTVVFEDLWEELMDEEWQLSKLRAVGNIIEDWQYVYDTDVKEHWRDIVPDPYAELKEDFKETIRESFVDGKKILGEE